MHIRFISNLQSFSGGFGVQAVHMCNEGFVAYKEDFLRIGLRFASQRVTDSPPASPFRRVIARIRLKVAAERASMGQPWHSAQNG